MLLNAKMDILLCHLPPCSQCYHNDNDNCQAKMAILLSSCGTNQFSCSDGSCVDLQMRCDLFPDCQDKVCTIVIILIILVMIKILAISLTRKIATS